MLVPVLLAGAGSWSGVEHREGRSFLTPRRHPRKPAMKSVSPVNTPPGSVLSFVSVT